MKNSLQDNTGNYGCEHCGRTFIRENTLVKHICEQKHRWLDRDRPGNRIGYGAWKNYFTTHHPAKKNLEYSDFTKSNYYTAFVKFGQYCVDITAINPAAYAAWLVKNKIPIDAWASDRSYTKYLVDYIRSEDPFDAVKRTVNTLLELCNEESLRLQDVFKYLNPNKLCYLITTGKISPWVLYNSAGGIQFLSGLDTQQTGLVFEYIDPERWNIKFKREGENTQEVKTLLKNIPL